MKTFEVKLADGEVKKIQGVRMTRDGSGIHIYDADGDVIAAFTSDEVKSIVKLP